jgi:hypothetical protein
VNDEWAAQRLIELGTDGIITDRVDLFSPATEPVEGARFLQALTSWPLL